MNSPVMDDRAVNVAMVQDWTPPSINEEKTGTVSLEKTQQTDAPVYTPPSINTAQSSNDKALSDFETVETDVPVQSKKDAPVQTVKQAGFGVLICEHCQKEVQRKVWNQRFCCDECRTTFHGFRFTERTPPSKRTKKVNK